MVLNMNVPLYGAAQMRYFSFRFSKDESLLCHINNQGRSVPIFYIGGNTLVVLVAWVDDVMKLGPPILVEKVPEKLKKAFACKSEGTVTEYVGSKITMIVMIWD